MKILAERHKELSQTITSLIGSIRTETGCKRCDFSRVMRMKIHSFFLVRGFNESIDFGYRLAEL
jgi:hypothetical protein